MKKRDYSANKSRQIIIVDNCKTTLNVYRTILQKNLRSTDTVRTFDSQLEAAEYFCMNSCDLLIVNYEMPQMNGVELIKILCEIREYKYNKCILLSDGKQVDETHDIPFNNVIDLPKQKVLSIVDKIMLHLPSKQWR